MDRPQMNMNMQQPNSSSLREEGGRGVLVKILAHVALQSVIIDSNVACR